MSQLRWNKHIRHIKNKAISSLVFFCHNFRKLAQKFEEQLYFTYVCSILDYNCVCWDSHTADLTEQLERVRELGFTQQL